jgi:hypothetical protein
MGRRHVALPILTKELSMSPLRRRMIDDMQIRNLTPNTQRVYVAQVVRFACHFRKSPELLGPDEIRTYLIHLTQQKRLAASSIIVAVSALRFFFTVTLKRSWIVADDIPAGRQAKKLPVVLTSAHSFIYGHFRPRRHRLAAPDYREIRSDAFNLWQRETCGRMAA